MGNAVVHYSVVADCAPAMRSTGALIDQLGTLSGTRVSASVTVAGVGQAMSDYGRLADAQQGLATPLAMSVSAPSGISDASAALQGLRGDADDLSHTISSMPSLDVGLAGAGAGAGAIRPLIDNFGALSDVVTGATNAFSGLDAHAGSATRSLADADRATQSAAASAGHAGAAASDYGERLDSASASLGGFTTAHGQATSAAQMQSSAVAMLTDDMTAFDSQFAASARNVGRSADEMALNIQDARRVSTFGNGNFGRWADADPFQLERSIGVPGTGHGPPGPPRLGGGGGGGDGLGGVFGDMGDFAGEHAGQVAMMGGLAGAVLAVVGAAEPIVAAAGAMKAFQEVVKDNPALMAASTQAMSQFSDGVRAASQGIENEGVPAFMRFGQAMLPFGEEVGRVGSQQMPNIMNAANQLIPDATSGLKNLEPGFGPAVQGTGDVVDSALKGIMTPQMGQDIGDVGQMLQRPDVNRGVSEGLGDLFHVAAKTAEVAGPAFGATMDRMTGRDTPWFSFGPPRPSSYNPDSPLPGPDGGKTYGTTAAMLGSFANAGGTAIGDMFGALPWQDGSMFAPLFGGQTPQNLIDAQKDVDQRSDAWWNGTPNPPPGGPAGPGASPGASESIANAAGSRLPTPAIDKDFFKDHPAGGTFKDAAGNTITGQMGPDGSLSFQNKYASGDAGTYSYDAASGTSSIAAHSLTDKFGSFADATITRAGSGEQYGQAQDYDALTGKVSSAGPTESMPGQAGAAAFPAPSLAVAQNMLANLPGGAGGGGGSGGGGGGGGGGMEKYPPDVPRSIFNEEPPEIATNYDAFGVAHSHITNDFAQANVNVDHGHVSFATPFDAQVSNFSQAQLGQAVSNIGAPLGTPSNQGMSIMGQPANQSIMGPVGPQGTISHPTFDQFAQQQATAHSQQATAAINSQANALSNLANQSHTAAQAQTNLSAAIGNVTADAGKGETAQTGLANAQTSNAQASQANANASQANADALGGLSGAVGAAGTGIGAGPGPGLSGQSPGPGGLAGSLDMGMTGALGIGSMTGLSGIAAAIGLGPPSNAPDIGAAAPGIASGIGATTGAALGGVSAGVGGTAGSIGAGIGASVGAGAGSPASTGAAAQGGADAGAAGAAGTGSSSGSDSHSPSRKSYQVGLWIGEGLVVGMKASESSVASAGASVGRAGVDGANNSMAAIAGAGVTAAIDSVASAQTAYNTALAGGFGASLIAASNGVTPIAQDYGLMIGYSWAENVKTGAQNVLKSSDFTALTTPQFGSKRAQARLGLENLLPPAGQGAEYYTTTSGSAGMVQMAPVQVTNKIYLDGSLFNTTVDTKISTAIGNLATAIGQQRG